MSHDGPDSGSLYLIRHGRPLVDATVPAADWELDSASFDDVWALRDRIPQQATWFTSPEPKAVATAQLLTDGDVGVVPALAEQHRQGWVDDFSRTVRRAFADPEEPAAPGWEPLASCQHWVADGVRQLLDEHPGDMVLVGHGTAWTALVADLTGQTPDLGRWENLACPDVIVVPRNRIV